MDKTQPKPLISTLLGNIQPKPPVWMMRQAGRHLEEYRELRAQAKDFIDFCYTPSLAAEATLQPIRRYQMDGAILFADILLILDAMGRDVHFEPGVGPIVEKVDKPGDLEGRNLSSILDRVSPVFETVSRVRAALPQSTTLIGFAGAPWTVALYALEGRGKTDKSIARLWAYRRSNDLAEILNHLVEVSAHYLKAQVDAGADVLMLFESWAEGLPDDLFREVVIRPNAALVKRLRALGVMVPIIGFPRGVGGMLRDFVDETKVSCVGLDTSAVPEMVNRELPVDFPVQGQLDPLLLLAGGEPLTRRVRALVEAYSGRPHIFNLGHGVLPQTPVEHVEHVLRILREDEA